jgi:copper resistance protein B
MKRVVLFALMSLPFATPALGQAMDPSMPGMKMPMTAKPSAKLAGKAVTQRKHRHAPRHRHAAARTNTGHDMAFMPGMVMAPGMVMPGMGSDKPAVPPEVGQDMAAMPGMTMPPSTSAAASPSAPGMAGMDMSAHLATAASGQAMGAMAMDAPAGNEPAPAAPTDHAADRDFSPAAMAAARAQLHREHGGDTYTMVMTNLLEYQARDGGAYRWDGEGSFGGDINRLFLKTEGEGSGRSGVAAAEVQTLYSRAVSPYFNLQAGVRQDIKPTPTRTYATVGFEGLAPYWFEVSGAVFVSTRGEVLGRLEGYYDQRLTQRLILQPRVELNFAAQNTREIGIGSGVSNAELGLRLRYEITRQFAPYIGVSFDRKLGTTADYARARGQSPGGTSLVLGVKKWF